MSTRPALPLVALVLVVLGGVAWFGSDRSPSLIAPPVETTVEVDTPQLAAKKAELGVAACPGPGSADRGSGSDLAPVTLPCLGGGAPVALADVAGPAVLPLWASWCVNCVDELPLYERLAKQTRGRLSLLGVDWQDTQPGMALGLLEATGATFPQTADPAGVLADHYRLVGLPAVLLVDAGGEVTFKTGRIDSFDELVALVEEHTGVGVEPG